MARYDPVRDTVAAQMKEAMKAGEKTRVGALRLIMAALKEREIEARGAGKIVSRADELALLTKMVKSARNRRRSTSDNGRAELAAQEEAEIAVINEFLPKQMDEAAVIAAAKAAIAATGAASMRDMGKVVAALKDDYPGPDGFRQGERRSSRGCCAELRALVQDPERLRLLRLERRAPTRASPRPPTSSAARSLAAARLGWCSAAATAA